MSTIYLDSYLNSILTKIYSSQPLCKLLAIDDNNNPIGYPDIVDTSVLKTDATDKRIFVIPFNIDVVNSEKTVLTININNINLDNKNTYYKEITTRFFITCPYRLWELENEDGSVELRVNAIVHYLLDLFNRQSNIGIGSDLFIKLYSIFPNQQIGGVCLELWSEGFILNH